MDQHRRLFSVLYTVLQNVYCISHVCQYVWCIYNLFFISTINVFFSLYLVISFFFKRTKNSQSGADIEASCIEHWCEEYHYVFSHFLECSKGRHLSNKGLTLGVYTSMKYSWSRGDSINPWHLEILPLTTCSSYPHETHGTRFISYIYMSTVFAVIAHLWKIRLKEPVCVLWGDKLVLNCTYSVEQLYSVAWSKHGAKATETSQQAIVVNRKIICSRFCK